MSSQNDSLLKELTKLIPGYGAYQEQESRREDDRLTREFLVRRLGECKSSLATIGRAAVARGDLESPAKVERVRDSIDHASRRLAAAVEGYAGWFGERKVDAKLLADVATLDANLVSLVDQIDSISSGQTESETQDFAELEEAIALLHKRIDRRTEILKSGA